MCTLDDGEQADIWREDVRVVMRPRKQRECDGCGAVIGAGEPFIDHFDLYEGNANSEAGCFACWWTREVFADDHGGMRYPFGMLMEQLEQCIGENMRRVYRDDSSWPDSVANYDDEWRPHLAALKRRYRASPQWSRKLWRDWTDRREQLRAQVLALDGFGSPS
jgi:hypothetical protein